jgi:hypothetical protein
LIRHLGEFRAIGGLQEREEPIEHLGTERLGQHGVFGDLLGGSRAPVRPKALDQPPSDDFRPRDDSLSLAGR